MEVEVTTSLPSGKSPEGFGTPGKSLRVGGALRPARPGPRRPEAREPRNGRAWKALPHLVARWAREGGSKHSSSSSSSKKKHSSLSKAASSKGERKGGGKVDRSPHRSYPACSSSGSPRGSGAKAARPLPSLPKVARTPVPPTPAALGVLVVDPCNQPPGRL